jgi:hypothetical protein
VKHDGKIYKCAGQTYAKFLYIEHIDRYEADWIVGGGSRIWKEYEIDERVAGYYGVLWREITKLERYLYGVEHETET